MAGLGRALQHASQMAAAMRADFVDGERRVTEAAATRLMAVLMVLAPLLRRGCLTGTADDMIALGRATAQQLASLLEPSIQVTCDAVAYV